MVIVKMRWFGKDGIILLIKWKILHTNDCILLLKIETKYYPKLIYDKYMSCLEAPIGKSRHYFIENEDPNRHNGTEISLYKVKISCII